MAVQFYTGINADSFVKVGGTSTQYLMADGSVTTSSGGSSPWSTDTNGIAYTAGNVGIGTASIPQADLKVGTGGFMCEGNSKVSGNFELGGAFSVQNGAGSAGQYLTLDPFGLPQWTTLTIPGGTTYTLVPSSVTGGALITLDAASGTDSSVKLVQGTDIGITSTASGIEIAYTGTGGGGGTTYSLGHTTATGGALIQLDAASGTDTQVKLIEGSNVSISSGVNGITISSSGGTGGGDITAVTAGNGLSGGGITGDVTLSANLGSGLAISGGQIVPDGSIVRVSQSNQFGSAYYQRFSGAIRDAGNSAGSAGQTLQSTGSAVDWVSAGSWRNSGFTNYISGSNAKVVTNGTTADGWLHIRKTSASTTTPTAMFQVMTNTDTSDNFVTFKNSDGSRFWSHGVDSSENKWKIGYTTTGAGPFATTSPVKFKLDTAGNVTAGNFILDSDERLKENIKDVDYSEHIKADWKTFNLKESKGEKRYGVIAQELESVHPEFVDTDEEGYKSVKYIDLLVAKIAELEARLEKLEK